MKKTHLKRAAAFLLTALMAGTALAGCGGSSSSKADSDTSSKAESGSKADDASVADLPGDPKAGKVYYLQFKPEQGDAWKALAEKYTKETGIPVTVVTAAEGTYETTLATEMTKTDAPTLFQVNGPVGLSNWSDFCYDLKGTELFANLTSQDYALTEDDAVKELVARDKPPGICLDDG